MYICFNLAEIGYLNNNGSDLMDFKFDTLFVFGFGRKKSDCQRWTAGLKCTDCLLSLPLYFHSRSTLYIFWLNLNVNFIFLVTNWCVIIHKNTKFFFVFSTLLKTSGNLNKFPNSRSTTPMYMHQWKNHNQQIETIASVINWKIQHN